jgi:hypothetical protein
MGVDFAPSDELTKQLEKNLDRLEYELDESARALDRARFESRHFERLASFRGSCMVALSIALLIVAGLAVTK